MNADAALREFWRTLTIEEMLTNEHLFNLDASDVQRGLCRVTDGKPLGELASNEHVRASFAGVIPDVGKPKEVACVCGVRTGKSVFAAAAGGTAAITCDVSCVGPGDMPRVGIVSTSRDNAAVVFGHLRGRFQASAALRSLILDDKQADRLVVRHYTGIPVEICVLAGSRAGSSLVARWMAAVIFDEYARMNGSASEGVVNWEECRRAVLHRILPGGYILHITAPHAPFGAAYEHVSKHWGRPTKQLVVMRAKAYEMNPAIWTPERVAEARESDPDVFKTDVLAEFASPEEHIFHGDQVTHATRSGPLSLPYEERQSYFAVMDPATRGNGWTLAICTRIGDRRIIAHAQEWIGSKAAPLDPVAVMSEVAEVCRRYHVTSVATDQWMGDAIAGLGRERGLNVYVWTWTGPTKTEHFLSARTMFALARVELPPIDQMATDLVRVKKRITQSGATIVLPETNDGRHCDWAPCVVMGLTLPLADLIAEAKPMNDIEVERMREASRRKYAPQEGDFDALEDAVA